MKPKSQAKKLIDYFPAELRECESRWYINYQVKNPATGILTRKQIRVPALKSETERRRYAKELVKEINNRLQSGWNPYIEAVSPKAFHLLTDTFEAYLKLKKKELAQIL